MRLLRYALSLGGAAWWRKLREAGEQASGLPEALPTPVFVEAVMDENAAVTSAAEHPAMIIDLSRGERLSIYPAASPALVTAASKALR